MEKILIAYYPGSGGTRLAYYLYNGSWDSMPGQHYHTAGKYYTENIEQNKIILGSIARTGVQFLTPEMTAPVKSEKPIEFTHCMNSQLLKQFYPDRKIIKIKSPLLPALARYWKVFGLENSRQGPMIIKTRFDSPEFNAGLFYFILYRANFEAEYYTTYPVDWTADQLFDIENDDNEFCQFMRNEYQIAQSPEAIEAWAILRQTKYTNFNL